MRYQWLGIEHYRLHVVEEWPESPRKRAALEAIRSTIRSLSSQTSGRLIEDEIACPLCDARVHVLDRAA